MANAYKHGRALAPGEFEIYFDNKAPIPTAQLGKLLSALATDYRRFTKRSELVLVSAEDGSLKLKLGALVAAGVAAIACMEAANTLVDFGKNVMASIEAARGGEFKPPRSSQHSVEKSARAILATAVTSKSNLRLEYENADGERLKLEVDAQSAERAQSNLEAGTRSRSEAPQRLLSSAGQKLLESRVDEYAAQRHLLSPDEQRRRDDDFALVVEMFVEALRENGNDYLVEQVAQRMEARGLYELAQRVRTAQGRGRSAPRITASE
jgi:hypothetical protein